MCFPVVPDAFPARADKAFDLPQCVGAGSAFPVQKCLLHRSSLLSSGEAFLCAAGAAFAVEQLVFAANAAVPALSACASVRGSRDRIAAVPAASAGRRFVKGAFAAVRTFIQISHTFPPFTGRD